ncbi:MAG: hypothetical protein RLZZ164_122 [Actinomycetota bacterium]|jgi:FtsZ-interacting cell division protein YlmF
MSVFANAMDYMGFGNGRNREASAPRPSAVGNTVRAVTALRPRRNDGIQIETIVLNSYSQAREVSDAFRDGYQVIVEMSGASETDQQKMLNYMCGLKEGLMGTLQRVTKTVFLLAHDGASTGEDIDEAGDNQAHDDLIIRPNY